MINIPVVTSDPEIVFSLKTIANRLSSEVNISFPNGKDKIIEYFKYDLPELKILDYSAENEITKELIHAIKSDPWLHYGGIIAIHDYDDEKPVVDLMKDCNLIAVLKRSDFFTCSERLLKILIKNKQFLFQRGMQKYLIQTISGSFIMDNDPLDINVYTNLITNYLYNSNLINKDDKERLHISLQELIVNAIEHGNCKISFNEKTNWMESGKNAMDLIREKNKDPEISQKKVHFSYSISSDTSRFNIRDEGDGFDWRARVNLKPSIGFHGMGIHMANFYANELRYNDTGNEVSFLIRHQKDSSNMVPQIFCEQEEVLFKDREIVVKEGDNSDYLYYIISGRYLIFSSNKYISYLTPDDMFIGEMSFLLSNQRSATVVSFGEGKLIKISKQAFVDLIKKNPHYGIFLARLLARRITRLNVRAGKLNAECLRLKKKLSTN